MQRFPDAQFPFLLDGEATKHIEAMAELTQAHRVMLKAEGTNILKRLQLSPEQRRLLAIKDKALHDAKCAAVEKGGGDPKSVLPAWETVIRPGKQPLNRDRTDYTLDDTTTVRTCIRRILRYPTNKTSSFAKWGAGDGELRINHTFNVLNARDSISLQELADATGLEIIIEVTSDSILISLPIQF